MLPNTDGSRSNRFTERSARIRLAEVVAHVSTLSAIMITYVLAAVTVESNPVARALLEALGYPATAGIALAGVSIAFVLFRHVADEFGRTAEAGGWSLATIGIVDVGINLSRLIELGLPETTSWSTVATIVATGLAGGALVHTLVEGRRRSDEIVSVLERISTPNGVDLDQVGAVVLAVVVVISSTTGLLVVGVGEVRAGTVIDDFEADAGIFSGQSDVTHKTNGGAVGDGYVRISGFSANSDQFTGETDTFTMYVRMYTTGAANVVFEDEAEGATLYDLEFNKNGNFNIFDSPPCCADEKLVDGSEDVWYRLDFDISNDDLKISVPSQDKVVYDGAVTQDESAADEISKIYTGQSSARVDYDYVARDLKEYSVTNISGTVKDSSGSAINDATVEISNSTGTVESLKTNSSGYYLSSNLASDGYTVKASKTGYTSENTTVSLSGSSVTDVNFSLIRTGVDGYVKDPTGTAISGATVEAIQNGSVVKSTTASSNGSYALDLSPGDYKLKSKSNEFGTRSASISVAGTRESVNFSYGREVPVVVEDYTEDGLFSDTSRLSVERPSGDWSYYRFNHNNKAFVGLQNGKTYNFTVNALSDYTPAVYDLKGFTLTTLIRRVMLRPGLATETTPTPTPTATSTTISPTPTPTPTLSATPTVATISEPEGFDVNFSKFLSELEDFELNGTTISVASPEPIESLNYSISSPNGTTLYNDTREFGQPTEYYEGTLSDNITSNASQYDDPQLEYSGEFANGTSFNGTTELSGSFSGGGFGPTGGGGSGGSGSTIVGISIVGVGAYAAYRTLGKRNVGQTVSNVARRIR